MPSGKTFSPGSTYWSITGSLYGGCRRRLLASTGMTDTERPEPPIAGTEVETMLGSLERQRYLFAWKCGGVDAAGMRATLGPSTMTLGGLVKHLALVEDTHFARLLLA